MCLVGFRWKVEFGKKKWVSFGCRMGNYSRVLAVSSMHSLCLRTWISCRCDLPRHRCLLTEFAASLNAAGSLNAAVCFLFASRAFSFLASSISSADFSFQSRFTSSERRSLCLIAFPSSFRPILAQLRKIFDSVPHGPCGQASKRCASIPVAKDCLISWSPVLQRHSRIPYETLLSSHRLRDVLVSGGKASSCYIDRLVKCTE